MQQNNQALVNDCQRCFKKIQNQVKIIRLPNCLHQFCKNCLGEQFQEKIQNQTIRIEDFNCYFCQAPFNPELTQKFLTQDQQINLKNIFKVFYQLENDKIKMICFNRFCKKAYTMFDDQIDIKCVHCKKKYCRKCNLEYHENANNYQTCEEKQEEHSRKEFFNMKRVLKLQKCPNCESLCKRKVSFFTTCECGVNFCFICNKQREEQEQFTHYEDNDPFQGKCKEGQNQPLQMDTNCQFCNSQTYRAFKDQITICNSNNCLHKALCLYCKSTVDPKDLGSHFELVEAKCFKQIQDEIFSQNSFKVGMFGEYLHSIDVKTVQNEDKEIIYLLALGFTNYVVVYYKQKLETQIYYQLEGIHGPITSIQFCVGYKKFSDKQIIYLGTQNGDVKVLQFLSNEQQFKSIEDIDSFKNKITCIKSFIWNQSEYFLASSYDSTIQLFKITRSYNLVDDKVKYNVEQKQTLQSQTQGQILKGHKDPVFWLTLSQNNSESLYMASSGKDEQILIWKWNNKKEEWEAFSKHQKNQYGNRIAFFDSDTLIWQLYKKPIFRVLKHNHLKNQKMIEYDQLRIRDFSQEKWQNDVDDFPLIQNEQNNFIVAKFTDRIHIIKKNLNNSGIFQVQPTLIQCDQYCNLGAVTQDGKYIYLYSYKDKVIMRYKLFLN